jgi:hypothetical protein
MCQRPMIIRTPSGHEVVRAHEPVPDQVPRGRSRRTCPRTCPLASGPHRTLLARSHWMRSVFQEMSSSGWYVSRSSNTGGSRSPRKHPAEERDRVPDAGSVVPGFVELRPPHRDAVAYLGGCRDGLRTCTFPCRDQRHVVGVRGHLVAIESHVGRGLPSRSSKPTRIPRRSRSFSARPRRAPRTGSRTLRGPAPDRTPA